uniref:ATP-binding protein n=1 Tax=Streptomyces sp. NBC_00857 TaxID=2975851 RepID=UPI002F917E3E|nr:ATP-binding protein [Streptomyces sp. NBC_00857]
MSSITRPRAQVVLTFQDIDEWPERAPVQNLISRCAERGPVSFSVPPLNRAVPICRQLVGLWLNAEGITNEDARYTTLLIVSELMTNAVEHSGSARIISCLRRDDDRVFIEVRDQSRTSSIPRQPRRVARTHRLNRSRENGRGLVLVAKLAENWGVQTGNDGICSVWAAVRIGR